MNSNNNKEALLQKIKALAERGIDGEKENANDILQQLMLKYEITEEEIIEDAERIEWFRYHDEFEKRILMQIIYMVTGKRSSGCIGQRTKKKRGIICTTAEKIEIDLNFNFFLDAAKKELDTFFTAFANKNSLFPDDKKNTLKQIGELSEEEKKRQFKAGLMQESMEKYTIKKMIEAGATT